MSSHAQWRTTFFFFKEKSSLHEWERNIRGNVESGEGIALFIVEEAEVYFLVKVERSSA